MSDSSYFVNALPMKSLKNCINSFCLILETWGKLIFKQDFSSDCLYYDIYNEKKGRRKFILVSKSFTFFKPRIA